MRRLLLLFAILLTLVFGAGVAYAGELTTEAGHIVRWDDGVESLGRRVAELIPRVEAEVARRLGWEFEGGPATIVVASGLDSMRKHARAGVPDWAGGVCIGTSSLIVLRAERITPPTPQRSPLTVLRHEWVHLAWARKARFHIRNLPLWAEEGLAETIGGGTSVDLGSTLDFAAAGGHLIRLDEISSRFPQEGTKAGLAYRQGQSWISHFVKHESWSVLRSVLLDVAEGKGRSDDPEARAPFDVVLRARTGRHLDEWTAEWRVALEKDARPFFHLFGHDVGWSLIVLMSFVCVGLFFLHRRRRRREISELPDG